MCEARLNSYGQAVIKKYKKHFIRVSIRYQVDRFRGLLAQQ